MKFECLTPAPGRPGGCSTTTTRTWRRSRHHGVVRQHGMAVGYDGARPTGRHILRHHAVPPRRPVAPLAVTWNQSGIKFWTPTTNRVWSPTSPCRRSRSTTGRSTTRDSRSNLSSILAVGGTGGKTRRRAGIYPCQLLVDWVLIFPWLISPDRRRAGWPVIPAARRAFASRRPNYGNCRP